MSLTDRVELILRRIAEDATEQDQLDAHLRRPRQAAPAAAAHAAKTLARREPSCFVSAPNNGVRAADLRRAVSRCRVDSFSGDSEAVLNFVTSIRRDAAGRMRLTRRQSSQGRE